MVKLLCILLALMVPAQSMAQDNPGLALAALQEELLAVNRELMFLEEDLLYPPSSRVAVYLALDTGTLLDLQAVKLRLNGEEVAHHLYSASELDALRRGAVQPLYVGNVPQGENSLVAVLVAHGPQQREIRTGVELQFDKTFAPAYVTLDLVDDSKARRPVLRAAVH